MEGSRLLRRGASLGNDDDDDNEYATTWADAAAGTKQTNRIERRRRQAEREKSSGMGIIRERSNMATRWKRQLAT